MAAGQITQERTAPGLSGYQTCEGGYETGEHEINNNRRTRRNAAKWLTAVEIGTPLLLTREDEGSDFVIVPSTKTGNPCIGKENLPFLAVEIGVRGGSAAIKDACDALLGILPARKG